MCGISAIINTASNAVGLDRISRMNALIRHRGPDGESFFIDRSVALGHRMLKILELGPANVQPMRFKNYVITYNGEIYNFKLLRQELKKLGYSFSTDTDTEVILAAYDAWKEQCVHHFNGMWAFVLYDQERNLIFASRDRFGIKPLCYTQLHEHLLIGSEIKQFTAFAEFKPRLNHHAAFDFLCNGMLNKNEESIFENVKFLSPGCNLVYDLHAHTLKLSRWYELKHIRKIKISLPEAFEEFRRLFKESMLDHLYCRVPLGSCLSGGLDSTSMIAAASQAGFPLKTYSSCFLESQYNEINFINATVDHFQLPNYQIYPNLDELITKGELNNLVFQQDQPITCGSFFSEYKIFELAARHQTRVILGGGGADEYLGGYGEFYLVFLKSLMRRGQLPNYASEFLQLPQLKIRLTQMLRSYYYRITRDQTSPFAQDNLKNYFTKDWYNDHYVQADPPEGKKDIDELSVYALLNYSLPHQLHSEDRNSMHFSLESRLPYLDHRLVEFCLSVPENFKLRNGTTKYLLRESMRDDLPPIVYQRKNKLGLPGPEEPLFRSQLPAISARYKELIQDYPGIFSDELLTLLHNYGAEKIPYHNFLFRVLSFAAWAKQFNVSSCISQKRRRSNYGLVGEQIKEKVTSY